MTLYHSSDVITSHVLPFKIRMLIGMVNVCMVKGHLTVIVVDGSSLASVLF